METAFYKLHRFYQHGESSDKAASADLSEQLKSCCTAANVAHLSFAATQDPSGASKDELLSFIEADCIPVRSFISSA